MEEKKLFELIKNKDVYVYGAGKNAMRIYEYLKDNKRIIKGFIVGNANENPSEVFGIPVMEARKYNAEKKDIVLCSIVFGISKIGVYREVIQQILSYGWENVIFFSKNTFKFIYSWKCSVQKGNNSCVTKYGKYYIDNNFPVELNHSVFVMEKDNKKYRWRIENATLKDIFASTDATFKEKSALMEFEEQFGDYISWKDLKKNSNRSSNGLIYMTRHVGDVNVAIKEMPSWIVPIQVGAADADRTICSLRDDQGENISSRNPIYSEATAIYWMWKHAPVSDYIGLFHYRRQIDFGDKEITDLNDIDVLVTIPTFFPEGNKKIFSRFVPNSDIEQLFNAIENMAPDYLEDARAFFASRFYPPCNLFVMRQEIFQKYATFVFSVTFYIDRYYQEKGIYRFDRYMGYLVECLLGIFLMHHKDVYRIAYSDMLFFKA